MDASGCEGAWPARHASPDGGLRTLAIAVLIAGCGTPRHVYMVRPLPVLVNPGGTAWGVEVGIDLTDAIHLQVANTGAEPVRIVWDECAYIDLEGRSHRVLTAQAKLASDRDSQVPASVAPDSRLEEVLYPIAGPSSGGADPLLPSRSREAPKGQGLMSRLLFAQHVPVGHPALGKTIGVFLVLERGGDRKTLTASYTVTAVHTDRRG